MTSPVAQITEVEEQDHHYQSIKIICPACDNLHLLPISGDVPPGKPRWDFDGNLEAPTLNPSILTKYYGKDGEYVCHSFLRSGRWQYLDDCTHQYAGQTLDCVPLKDWQVR